MEAVVVVPTARERSLAEFLDAWSGELAGATILVIEDGPHRTFAVSGRNVHHFAWCDIEDQLGDAAWIIPRGSGCIRSFGCWVAYHMRPDLVVTLDDDTRPDPAHPGFLDAHWTRLQTAQDPACTSTLDAANPRGVPYFALNREPLAVVNHGLWSGVPDFDAATQLLATRVPVPATWSDRTIPRGTYFPMCSMNLAWRREFTPAMYFQLMGPDYPFDRFGDIWAGVLAKRVADHLGFAVNSGSPGIIHERASNVFTNLAKESRGLARNETFWRAVDSVVLTAERVASTYSQLAERLPLDQAEFAQLRDAMLTWARLFGDDETSAQLNGRVNGLTRARGQRKGELTPSNRGS